MSRAFRFDDPGEGIREAEVTEVLVSVGDNVNEGDEVLIVETDKATTDLPSPYTGTVEEIHVSEGDVIEVGDAMITFSGAGEDSGGGEDETVRESEDSQEAEPRERRSGGTAFTPVVNHPEVGILGMAQARLQQVVTGDLDEPRTDVRLMLPLSFSFDHRVNDGADAARFISDVGEILADPDAMLLKV